MKRFLYLFTFFPLGVILSACNPPGTPTPTDLPSLMAANVTCLELSFFLDPALGNGIRCETVPENSTSDLPGGMAYVFIFPAHTEVTLQGYPLENTQFPPALWIYPVKRFRELLPDYFPDRLSDLQQLLSGATISRAALPFLPANPQQQTLVVHQAFLSFGDGQGLRYITEYSDGPFTISNRNIVYTFQGLSEDGQYWLALPLPLSSPSLPDRDDTLPDGYTQDSLMQNWDAYVNEVRDTLQAQSPQAFVPNLDRLDRLVQSIILNP